MYKDQYVLKNIFKPTLLFTSSQKGANKIDLTETRWIDENGEPQSKGLVSFFDPKHISAILCNYNALKTETNAKYSSDFYYLIEDFDRLLNNSLKKEPMYKDIVESKIKGLSNQDIKDLLLQKYGKTYTVEYLSALWRNKIPKIIADYAKEDYLIWYYTYVKKGKWKTCSCCGETKLAHNRFFSKNKSSKDGWYSLCKECRNSKNKKQF